MSEPQRRGSLLLTTGDAAPLRRRRAPRAIETSDVRRFRGVAVGALVAAAVAGFGVAWSVDLERTRAPGPVSLPHHDAGLGCAACHASDSPTTSCQGCHGPHPSTRGGHRRMTEQGRMLCSTCHREHRDLGGVQWLADGRAVRFEGDRRQTLEPADAPQSVGRVTLPPVRACAGCHDPNDDRDPIARCLIAGQASLGPRRPTVCFDEHRSLSTATLATPDGGWDALPRWEAARSVAASHPVVEGTGDEERSLWIWLVAAFSLGLGSWSGLRWARRPRIPRTRAPDPAASVRPPEVIRLPQIDTSTCIGCSACVDACPYDVLELRNYVAVLARPGDCCGLTLCEQRCPNGSLRITDGDPIEDRPCVDPDLQSVDVPGLYLAGDLTGLPLIRNAISQGEVAIARVAASLASSGAAPAGMLDVVIVGAGPAGLSAALCAKAMGLHYEALEQGSVAESIRSFPRGKLVFDQPLEVPSVGTLWLRESTKEELLGKWLRIVRTHALSIREHHRVEHVAQTQGSFVIHARDGDGREVALATRRVVLAVGRRGTPRKLPLALPDAVLDHVHYSLADARSFSGARVVVVGLGDVAMESAMALARQPGTTVTVVYRGAGFRRGKARNIAEMRRLAAAGRIDLRLQADVVAVHPGQIELSGPGDLRSIAAYDALFVMIGSIPPWAFLEQIGIRRLAQSTLK